MDDEPAGVDDDVAGQFKKMGVVVDATVETAIAIHPANAATIVAWQECQTSWRVTSGMAGLFYIGLDYPACRLVMDDLGSPRQVFADLRHMERAALPILNKRDD